MKNILNNMSEEEKRAILEQHSGGKKFNTEKFSTLLEAKLGDVKPLTEQNTPTPTNTGTTPTQKTTTLGYVTGDLEGKTVNFYLDKDNKEYLFTAKISKIVKSEIFIEVQMIVSSSQEGSTQHSTIASYYFDCERKGFLIPGNDVVYYSTNFANELTKRFCDVSSGGVQVPAADFVQP